MIVTQEHDDVDVAGEVDRVRAQLAREYQACIEQRATLGLRRDELERALSALDRCQDILRAAERMGIR